MLKAAIAQMLVLRGLRLRSWYSSNHLGNRDGLVLSDPEFSRLKIADKKRGLTELAGLADADHVVSIDFVRSRGDQKESFDSVVASDIFGREVNLRFNWQGWDSALAVPMLLDLIRLVAVGQRLGLSGPQPQLAYFFKAPLGARCESPERAYARLVEYYMEACAGAGLVSHN
jgi:myo-inositol-1-phosphate synthase